MFYVGVDLGQRRDHSAIAVVERRAGAAERLVRSVVRVPLGTPYPVVVERVRDTVQHDLLWGECCLAVDATGVGAPVVEMLRAAQLGCELCAVTITGGPQEKIAGRIGGMPLYGVPKRDLLTGVQVLLERGELRIARQMPGVESLLRELRDMRVEVSGQGRVKMGAEGAGQHDDLVIALALACWRAGRRQIGFGEGRLPGC